MAFGVNAVHFMLVNWYGKGYYLLLSCSAETDSCFQVLELMKYNISIALTPEIS